MKIRTVLAGALVVGSLVVSTAFAETVVKVTLIDKMGTPDLSKPLGLGMGMKADMSTAKMGININPKRPHLAMCDSRLPTSLAILFMRL